MQVARLAQICEREELPRGTLRLLQLRNVNGFYEKYPLDQKDNDDSNKYEGKNDFVILMIMINIFQLSSSIALPILPIIIMISIPILL